jgi:predicted MPP superfamily phosphohydrolase
MVGFLIFVSAFLLVLVIAHYVVFASLASFFTFSGSWSRAIVWIMSAVFPANFFLASFLVRSVEGAFSRSWYLVSAFSLGVISNLFFLVLIGWGLARILRAFGAQPRMAVLGALILVLGTAVSVYGTMNAFRPVVRQTTVTVPGLPEEWKGKTIIQISDIHLGPVYRENFLHGVVDQVNAFRPAAVMIAGDLFDGMDGDLEGLVGPLGDIRTEKGVFFVTGNHETYLGVERSLAVLKETGVKNLDDEIVVVDGLAIIGISYPEREIKKDVSGVAASLVKSVSGMPNILLYHAPSDIDRMRGSGINLQLSGHTHQGQQIPFNLVTRLVHKGYDYGLYERGSYTLSVSSGVGTWGPPLRIGTQSEIVAITLE